jgi:NAD(P)-dependent dehydrogenase (short-subunit alcohol dehydrogenase family)
MMKMEYGEGLPPVALVTGSSRGLGRGIALELAKAGWSVAIHYAGNQGAAAETAELCKNLSKDPKARFETVRGDLASRASRMELVEATTAIYGEIDALVNNAGMGPRARADILQASEESFLELMATNLQGPYFLTQAFARRWLSPGAAAARIPHGRKIVFITSISSETASTGRGEYCVSKAGLSMAAKLWAVRLAAEAVQVYELRPGIMATDMTSGVRGKYDALLEQGIVPQKRWGTPNDVGLAVKALLSGDFPFSTGAVIDVDGGFHISRL